MKNLTNVPEENLPRPPHTQIHYTHTHKHTQLVLEFNSNPKTFKQQKNKLWIDKLKKKDKTNKQAESTEDYHPTYCNNSQIKSKYNVLQLYNVNLSNN